MKICRNCDATFEDSSLIYDEEHDCYCCPDCGEEVCDEYDEGWEAYNATQREREERDDWR